METTPKAGKLYKVVGPAEFVPNLESYVSSSFKYQLYRITEEIPIGEILLFVEIQQNVVENKYLPTLFGDKIEILLYKFLYGEKIIYLECYNDEMLRQVE